MALLGRTVRAAAWALGVLSSASWSAEGTVGLASVASDSIATPLTPEPGNASRGRAIVTDRQLGMCLLCHSGPFPEERTPGNLATNLAGTGSRWTAGQLRLRIVDSRRLDPQGIMPAYHRTEGLSRVPGAQAGRPLLDAQQVEDVVAFLLTLRD